MLLCRVLVDHLFDQHKLWDTLKLVQLCWYYFRRGNDISITQKGVIINENKCFWDKNYDEGNTFKMLLVF